MRKYRLIASGVGAGLLIAAGACTSNGGGNDLSGTKPSGATGGQNGAGGSGTGATGGNHAGAGGVGGDSSLAGAAGASVGGGGSAGGGGSGGENPGGCGGQAPAPSFGWANKLGDRGEPSQIVSDSSGQLYVLFRHEDASSAFLSGCTQLVDTPSSKTGYYVVKFDPSGSCLWSRWIGVLDSPAMHFLESSGKFIGVREDEVLAFPATQDGWLLNPQGGTVQKVTTAKGHVAASKDGFFVLGFEAGAGTRISTLAAGGKLTSSRMLSHGDGPGAIQGTARGSGSLALLGFVDTPIAELKVSPQPGQSVVFAAEMAADGSILWSTVLGTFPGTPYDPSPPIESPDGTLSFLVYGLEPSDSTWPASGQTIVRRAPDGSWSAQAFPAGVLFDAVPLSDGSLIAAQVTGADAHVGWPQPFVSNPGLHFSLVHVATCGWSEPFGSADTWVGIGSLASVGDGVVFSGGFGSASTAASCATASGMFGVTTLTTDCIGAFVGRLGP